MTTETVEKKEEQKAESKKPEIENVGSGTDSDSDDDAPDLEDAPDAATAAAQSQVRDDFIHLELKTRSRRCM